MKLTDIKSDVKILHKWARKWLKDNGLQYKATKKVYKPDFDSSQHRIVFNYKLNKQQDLPPTDQVAEQLKQLNLDNGSPWNVTHKGGDVSVMHHDQGVPRELLAYNPSLSLFIVIYHS